jgi:xanthine dehydrogenase accessory factor
MQGTVIVRGGGDLATGILYRLHYVGYRVVSLETERPVVVRKTVSAAQAVFEGSAQVEDIEFKLLEAGEFSEEDNSVPVWIDPEGESISHLMPDFEIDAIMAKNNIGTCKTMAPRVIGIGPGFTAGQDVLYVVETMRDHYLGRVISEGLAIPNTGVPGEIAGESRNRLLKLPGRGFLKNFKETGDTVEAGEKWAKSPG